MKENRYDDRDFFEKYSKMARSEMGLDAAGEWHELEKMLPNFEGKRVLDLGCGYGWHCIYAADHGAKQVTGIDISEKMLEVARSKTKLPNVTYIQMPIEDIDFAKDSFDVVISSLAFHYIEGFADVCAKVYQCLAPGGSFVFSAEHPVFTAYGTQDWYNDAQGNHLHWPVDRYFVEGKRSAVFLGEQVTKYHRTLTTYLEGVWGAGFVIKGVVEPMPGEEMLRNIPAMQDELRRPMMLLVKAQKPQE